MLTDVLQILKRLINEK